MNTLFGTAVQIMLHLGFTEPCQTGRRKHLCHNNQTIHQRFHPLFFYDRNFRNRFDVMRIDDWDGPLPVAPKAEPQPRGFFNGGGRKKAAAGDVEGF